MPAALAAFLLSVLSVPAGVLGEYNVIVGENLTSGSNIYGAALVGGNVSGNQMSVGQDLTSHASSDISLRVGGTISAGLHMQKGSIAVKDSANVTGSVNWNGGGSVVVDPAIDITPIWDDLLSLSSALGNLPATGTLDHYHPSILNQKLFDAGSEPFSVINITTADLPSAAAFLEMNAADTLLINVAGENVNWPGTNLSDGGFDGWRDNASRIVWNFYEAETVHFDRSIYGSILAPLADMTFSSDIYGTVVAQNLTMGAQIHLPTFEGEFPPLFPIPEPSSLLALGTGLSILSLVLRRRRNG